MGLGTLLVQTLLPIVSIIIFLSGNTSGASFTLKVNFMTHFFAPLISYNFISSMPIVGDFFGQPIPIMILAYVIIFMISVLSMYKASSGERFDGSQCLNYDTSSIIIGSSKIVISAIITSFVVMSTPKLQEPFIKLVGNIGDEKRIFYGIIGFYLAMVSLSSVSAIYLQMSSYGCEPTLKDVEKAYKKGDTIKYKKATGN